MYTSVGSSEIIDRVEHIRELHRQIHVSNDRERIAYQRREQKIKDFISNLRRTDARPMANMVRDMEEACRLTTDGAYRLFGYELDGIREFDLRLNGGRTHIECCHERLRPGEIHRALRVRNSREGQDEKDRHHGTSMVSKWAALNPTTNLESASARHWHLHRLWSAEICRDHGADHIRCLILPIYRVIAGSYHPHKSPFCSQSSIPEDATELALP